MRIAILASKKDPASRTIVRALRTFPFEKTKNRYEGHPVYELQHTDHTLTLYTPETSNVTLEKIHEHIPADLFIFATRHQSKAGTPSLSVHAPGNWGQKMMGGKDSTLSMTSALVLKKGLISLEEAYRDLSDDTGLEVTMEVTHHGPLVEKPCFFIEIGSSEIQWGHDEYGMLIAKAILKTISRELEPQLTAIGVGGTHYCSNLQKAVMRKNIAISHVCPKHALEHFNESMLEEAIKKTVEPIDFILLDWKGLGQEKQRIIDLLERREIPYKRVDKLLKEKT